MPTPPVELCYALVPCAGTGSRTGAEVPKQYVPVGGRSVIAHTLAALARVPRVARTLVVLAPDDVAFESAAPGFSGWTARSGGATRAGSVAAGLQALGERGVRDRDWVLVHDAARCLVEPAAIERLIDACIDDPVGGLLALPVADTLKAADAGQRATATIDRSGKWAAQTPQMFRLGLLREALARAGHAVTDESSAVEALGHAPRLVAGDAGNFKLTFAEDFARAERVLASREAIQAFVPARDLARSLAFYRDLGFTVHGDYGDVVALRRGAAAFLLQAFYEPTHAGNFMMSLMTQQLDAWHANATAVATKYGTRVESPAMRPWGLRDFVLFDPTGVLWRIAEQPTEAP